MRISELAGKEIIDIKSGVHLGIINNGDFLLSEDGKILSLVLPRKNEMMSFWSERKKYYIIPWENVKRIGDEIILVENAADYE
jgi:YlmC/YmxH family sporulation protein